MKITDENYSELLAQQDKLTVIDFWATWCGPCQRLSPLFETIEKEYEGRANIGKYNAENNEELLDKFNIRNVPTILFIKNGEVLERVGGAVNLAKLRELVEKYL